MLGLTPASDYSESSTCSTDAGKVCGSGQNAGRSGDGTADLLGMGLPIWGRDCRSGDGTADLGTWPRLIAMSMIRNSIGITTF